MSDETTPRASCVIAVHNDAGRLARCIDSLRAQSVSDIEIIVVDDGSTDASGELADAVAALDSRIRVLHEGHSGAAAARNRGAAAATAEWLVIQDADDVAMPDRVERLLAFAAMHPTAGVVACGVERVGPSGRRLGATVMGPTSLEEFRQIRDAGRTIYVINGTAMVRRELFLTVGGYPEDYEVGEDLALVNLRLAPVTDIIVDPRPSILMEVHADSLSRRQASRIVEADDLVRLNLRRQREGLPELSYEEARDILGQERWTRRLNRRRRQLWYSLFMRGAADVAAGSVTGAARIALATPLAPIRTAQLLGPRAATVSRVLRRSPTGRP